MRNLYMNIPRKWRSRIILWVVSFGLGLIITLIWDAGTLLAILLFFILIAVLFRTLGLTQALKLERWAVGRFLGHIRGMVVFAILPAIWVVVKDLIENPTMSSALALILVLLLIVVIWNRFEQIKDGWRRTNLSSRRRRHR